jgi:hypothetical protein
MPIGANAELGVTSYVAIFKESSFGTYPATAATGASSLEPLTIGFKTEVTSQKLEEISRNRGFTKRVQLLKNVKGNLEQYLHPQESVLLTALALGGGIVSASVSGGFSHSLTSGNGDTSPSSISMLVRKGSQHFFQYTGGKVNQMTISGNVGEPVKVAYEMIFKDSTLAGADISSSLSISSVLPFTYVNGQYQYAAAEANLTSTAAEEITGFELSINNNIKSDKDARALGANVVSVLPVTRRSIEFKITQRFDTNTAYNRFIQATQGAVALKFVSDTIATGASYTCEIRLPKVFLNSPDPEIKGPNDILMSEIAFDVLVDNPSTSTGKDIGITFINGTASY